MQPGSSEDAQSLALSACIYHSLLGHIPEYDRGIKRARFAVLRLTKVPAVLIEGGFLTNKEDISKLASEDYRDQIAAALADGILHYRNAAGQRKPTLTVTDSGKR